MSATAEKLKTELVGLSTDDRADLAHFLIQSLLPPPAMSEPEFDAELESARAKSGRATPKASRCKKSSRSCAKSFREIRQRPFRRA
jgi:hypothetical protein